MAGTFYGIGPPSGPIYFSFEDIAQYISFRHAPLYSRFMPKARVRRDKEPVEWIEKDFLSDFYLVTDLSASGSVSTVTVVFSLNGTSSVGPVYSIQLYDVIEVDDEKMRVTAIAHTDGSSGSTSCTVTRGAEGTTAAVHTAGTQAYHAGNTSEVDRAHSDEESDPGTKITQYFQRFTISKTVDTFNEVILRPGPVGKTTGWGEEKYRAVKELVYKIESGLLRSIATAPTTATKWGSFDGVIAAARNIDTATERIFTTYTDNAITEAQFENILDKLISVGNMVDLIVTGSEGMRAMNLWYHADITKDTENFHNLERVRNWLPSIAAVPHRIEVLRHRDLKSGEVLFLDTKKISMFKLYGPRMKVMGEDGGGPRAMWDAALCLAVKGVNGTLGVQGKILNLTGSA